MDRQRTEEQMMNMKNAEELTAFTDREDVELSDGALDAAAGVSFVGEISDPYPQVNPPKWPCPKCGSWNVINYDPGVIYLMRVKCKDCHFYGCRDGSRG